MSQTKTNNQQTNNQANKQADVLSKLQRLQEQRQSQKSNLTRFDGLVVVNVGVKPTEHFPKLKDSEGNKVKDENGRTSGLMYQTAGLILSQSLAQLRWSRWSSLNSMS